MNGDYGTLAAGDILCIEYTHHWHTAMMLDAGKIVHATSGGEPIQTQDLMGYIKEVAKDVGYIDDVAEDVPAKYMAPLKKRINAYRYSLELPTVNTGVSWQMMAKKWSNADDSTPDTVYSKKTEAERKSGFKSTSRWMGIEKADFEPGLANLPFGPDALARSLKWAQKYRKSEAFSAKRGTTCCAFIMACVQATFINNQFYMGESGLSNLQKVLGTLNNQRGDKSHGKGVYVENHAHRAVSNRVPDLSDKNKAERGAPTVEKDGAAALLAFANTKATGKTALFWDHTIIQKLVADSWADVKMPAAMMHDAKYMYSKNLDTCLKADPAFTSL